MPAFYEFFAGAGMARAGLGAGWTCLFANDFDAKKGAVYEANWGRGGELRLGDICDLTAADLPGRGDLAWGSFPCQDLSLAGDRAGLRGARSGTFYPFWGLMRGLAREGRAPRIVALENVCGALTSHGGADFAIICQTFAEAGYRCGALVIDAALFTPQSRPRLFLIGVRDVALPPRLVSAEPDGPFHTPALRRAFEAVPAAARASMLWWNVPAPRLRNTVFADLVEDHPTGVAWHAPAKTRRLLELMSDLNLAKVESARLAGRRAVGAVYRRTRTDAEGVKRQRAEVRFDDLAGCLRTPAGGSSRQTILVVDGETIRSRLISARETARLMGLPDDYRLPANYNDAYHLTGDGVAVDVVRHLAHHLLEPLLDRRRLAGRIAGVSPALSVEQDARGTPALQETCP
jgi:DNA (cytosine-5)-methyltransferase 1